MYDEVAARSAIEALRAEAAEAGDDAQVRLCDKAIAGDDEALARCTLALRNARYLGE